MQHFYDLFNILNLTNHVKYLSLSLSKISNQYIHEEINRFQKNKIIEMCNEKTNHLMFHMKCLLNICSNGLQGSIPGIQI